MPDTSRHGPASRLRAMVSSVRSVCARLDPATIRSLAVTTRTLAVLAVGLLCLLAAAAPATAAGGAAITDVTVASGQPDAGTAATHEVTVEATDVSDSATVTLALPAAFGDGGSGAITGVPAASVTSGDGEVVGDPSIDDGSVAVEVDVVGDATDVTVSVSLALDHPTAAATHDVTATVESADGSSATDAVPDAVETLENPTYLVDGEPELTVFDGQAVTVSGLTPDAEYTLRRDDGDGESTPVFAATADTDGEFAVETADLTVNETYSLGVEGSDDGFELVTHDLSARFGDETVVDAGDGSTTAFAVGSDLRTDAYPVNVSANGALDAEALFRVFTGGESPDGVPRDAVPGSLDEATATVGPSGFAVALYDPDVAGADERIVLLDGGENAGPVTFEGQRRTTYDVAVRAVDTGASATATVRVEEADLGGSFGQSLYETPAGDLVDVSVDLGEADSGYVVVGGNRLSDGTSAGYLDVLYVEGATTITVNTRLVGTNASSEATYDSDGTVVSYAHAYGADTPPGETEAFSDLRFKNASGAVVAENLAEFRRAADAGPLPAPLVPQRYRLTVGTGDALVLRDDGVVEPERPMARSHLRLTEPRFRERIDLFTTVGGSASEADSVAALSESGLERTAVTKGDRVVLGFEATGIWGALTHFADEETVYGGDARTDALADLLAAEEGVTLSVRQTNPGRNEDRAELDLSAASAGDAYVLYEGPEALSEQGDGPNAGTVYLVVDTRDDTAFTEDVEPGDEYVVEFALAGVAGDRYRFDRTEGAAAPFAAASATDPDVAEQYPYHSREQGRVSVSRTFTIREERFEYTNTTRDGDVLVGAGEDAAITGNTTMLPATDLTAEFVADTDGEPVVASAPVEIDENDSFSIAADFSGLEPGSRVTLELYRGDALYDSRTVTVVEDPADPVALAVADAPSTLAVTRGESLRNLSVAVRNDGNVEALDRLALSVGDDALTDGRRVRVPAGETETIAFTPAVVDLDPGEYPYTVAVDGDAANGTLIVEPSDGAPPAENEPRDRTNATDLAATGRPVVTDHSPLAAGDGAAPESDGESDADESDGASGSERDGNDEGDGSGNGDADESDGSGGENDEADGNDEADENADADESPDPDQSGGESSTALPLPLGVGTREAFGGTVVVGAIYLLGHWV